MTAAGCLLLAYSPSAAVILGYTTRRSALLVLTIGAAFVWLLAVLLASLVWLAIPPLKVGAGPRQLLSWWRCARALVAHVAAP